jgi:hypothetical protein
VRLRLEALETRCTPSTVTSLADSGLGSLRDAIASTPAGGVVNFQPGLTGVIDLASGTLVIDHSLTIAGPGAGALTISGDNAFCVFLISGPTPTVALSGLTIANGYSSTDGGGICNAGKLTITDCVITDNVAYSCAGGIANSGTLSLHGCTLSNNSATPGWGGGGGAIYNGNGLVTVTSCTFSGNAAEQGGAIINNGGILKVQGSTFSGNHGGAGGAIFNVFETAEAVITNSKFVGNCADTAAGYVGGAIANTLGDVKILGCTLIDNSAGAAGIAGEGGALYNQDGNVLVRGSLFYENSATLGGAVASWCSAATERITLDHSALYGNSATQGGGLYNAGGTVKALGSLIAGNTGGTANDVSGRLASQGGNLIGIGNGGRGYAATDLVGTLATPINSRVVGQFFAQLRHANWPRVHVR